jgi:hypothetical protein
MFLSPLVTQTSEVYSPLLPTVAVEMRDLVHIIVGSFCVAAV